MHNTSEALESGVVIMTVLFSSNSMASECDMPPNG
jgi:hypothetical protein